MLVIKFLMLAAGLWQPDAAALAPAATGTDDRPIVTAIAPGLPGSAGALFTMLCPPAGAIPTDVCGGPADAPIAVVWACDGASGTGDAYAYASGAAGDDEDEESDDTEEEKESAPRPGGPWIGVQLTPVPRVLASHLKLEGPHLMILNVVKDSPADRAGIEQYDVIASINDDPAPGHVREFVEAVRKLTVGQSAKFEIIRAGQSETIDVQVGERPEMGSVEYKYPGEPDSTIHDMRELRGGLFQRGPGGQWEFKKFENFPWGQPGALPPNLMFLLDENWPTAESRVVIRELKDGTSVEINKDADGSFKVTRKRDRDGQSEETVQTYTNKKEFREGDPEAYEIYKKSVVEQELAGKARWRDLRRLYEEHNKLLEDPQMREKLEKAHREMQRAEEELAKIGRLAPHGRAGVQFEELDDGRIRVTTRAGGQELVQTYRDAEELKEKRPGLYRKYSRLQEQDQDEE